MTEPAFDESRMTAAVVSLETHQQLALGAVCCERSLRNYYRFREEAKWGDPEPLTRALNVAWWACRGFRTESNVVQELLVACEKVAPHSEDFDSIYTSAAQDAVFAICSLLDFLLEEDSGRIVNAARYATDTLDLIIQEQEDLDPQDPDLERKILEHPLMQRELLRQKRDLTEASQLRREDTVAYSNLRARAQAEELLR